MQGHPRWMGPSEDFWQNVVHWRRKWQTTPVFLPWEPQKRRKDMTPEDESPSLEGVQYASGGEWRAITNSSRKNKVVGTKQKCRSVVDMSGSES